MIKLKTLRGILLLSVSAVAGLLIALYAGTGQENELALAGLALPRAPDYPPVSGDHVSLGEAIARSPYTLPIPEVSAAGEGPSNIWVSGMGSQSESHQVYLVYDSGMRVSVSGQPPAIDYREWEMESFRPASVRGIPASGKDAEVKTTEAGEGVSAPASLSWWVNGVYISVYHPRMSMDDLLEIAETIPDPVWDIDVETASLPEETKSGSSVFIEVSSGTTHTCGLKPDGTVVCWGDPRDEITSAPPGEFDSISAGAGYTCAVRVEGTIDCWGRSYERMKFPGGKFTSVSAGGSDPCGVHLDGVIACWNYRGITYSPLVGEFASFSDGDFSPVGCESMARSNARLPMKTYSRTFRVHPLGSSPL